MNGITKPFGVSTLSAFLWIAVLLNLTGTPSSAREARVWKVDELHQASDLIVVAQFLAWKEIDWDFDEEPWRKLFDGDFGDYVRKQIMAREAVFRIDSVMKGEIATKTVRVLLCDYTENHDIENGFGFYPHELAHSKDGPQLMLFLKRSKDEGRYRPTTGHGDAVDSVHVLISPAAWIGFHDRAVTRSLSDEEMRRLDTRIKEIRSRIKASDAERDRTKKSSQ